MSFILDALRKSETERQRQSSPGLVDAGLRPPARRRGLWLPVLVAVLAANLALMGYFWLRRAPAPAPGPAPSSAAAPVASAISDAAPPAVGANPAAGPVDEAYQAGADLPAVESGPPASPPLPAGLEPAVDPDASAPAGAASHIVAAALPTAEQAMASGTIPAQTLHLDIHVYGAAPAERFVFINMRKYGEGALLPEGPKIEEITRDGVILSQAGQRFTLSRD